MRIGIYNHQHMRGGCKGCTQSYINGLVKDANLCKSKAIRIYGDDCEFYNYTDLGDYPSDNLDRPFFKRMMADLEHGVLDAIIVIRLSSISSDKELVIRTYKKIRSHNAEFLTYQEGKHAMEVLDEVIK